MHDGTLDELIDSECTCTGGEEDAFPSRRVTMGPTALVVTMGLRDDDA